MKKKILVVMILIAAVLTGLLISCPGDNISGDNDDPNDENLGQKTYIIFDNTQGTCTAMVYNDHRRRDGDKIVEVPAGTSSAEIEWTPDASVPFYFSYLVGVNNVSDFSFSFVPELGKDQKAVRIDPQKTTNIPVPKLNETLSSEDQLLSNSVYLLIKNNSSFSFELHRGASAIRPDNFSAVVVNSQETAIYRIDAGPASVYRLLVGAGFISLPDLPVNFETGYFYNFEYSSSVSLVSEIPLIFENVTVPPQPIPAPVSVSATALSSDRIQITWGAVPEATEYKIYRSNNVSESYELLGAVSALSYIDTGLSPSTAYYYRISAITPKGESGPSSPANAVTLVEEPIQPPAGLNASAMSSSSIQVSWNNVSGATGYRVYRSSSANGTYSLIGSAASSPYTDNGLSANSTWFYKVSSLKDSHESAQTSGFASATTTGSGGTIQNPPTMPTGLVVTSANNGSITLSWNLSPTADTYNIYRSSTQTGTAGRIGTVSGATFTNSSIPAGTSYFYSVAGENSSGESPRSNVAFAFASDHFSLSDFGSSIIRSIGPGVKHYFRLPVTNGQSVTIAWQNGNNQDAHSYIRVSAWQNNGTTIFTNQNYGFTNPRVFTATSTGFVTIEVTNTWSSSLDYQIYY